MQKAGHETHRAVDVVEEALVACAEVVESGFPVWGFDKTVLGAFPMACEQHVATSTVTREGVPLCLSEAALAIRGHKVEKVRLAYVA